MVNEYIYSQVTSAIECITDQSRLTDRAVIQGDFGRTAKIQEALDIGAKFPETFHSDHMEIVRKSFASIHATPPSERIDECCRELIRLMTEKSVG